MDLKNKKVTVMGLGLLGGGLGTTKWLVQQGAEVLVTDLKTEEELKPSLEELESFDLEYVLGEHRPQDFKETDMVVKSPAVEDDSKFLKVARENDVPIETEMSLFFKNSPCPIIGITGTKGKSTVATLTYKLLKQDYQTILGGNIKTETLPKLEELDENSLAILELSSWQLSSLEKDELSPEAAIITNIKQDHLNRYESFDDYVADKSVIYKHQTEEDYLALNYQDKVSSKFADSAKAQVYFYNFEEEINESREEDLLAKKQAGKKPPTRPERGATIKNDSIIFQGEEVCNKENVKLSGEHNLTNVLAAITMAKIYGVSNETIKEVVSEFSGLPHRLELVKEGKINFYNDSCATNPAATKAALNSFDEEVVLIAGGAEKDLEFEEVAKAIAKNVKGLILLKGEATPRLKKQVKEALEEENRRIPINQTESMEQAVNAASKLAEPNSIVLLSPACSSFGQFINEFDRGEKFKEAVKKQ